MAEAVREVNAAVEGFVEDGEIEVLVAGAGRGVERPARQIHGFLVSALDSSCERQVGDSVGVVRADRKSRFIPRGTFRFPSQLKSD